jgi:hypothetical protein
MSVRPQPFRPSLPLGRDPRSIRQRIEALEHALESLVAIPGTSKRVGLDVFLDFVPGVGPTVAAGLGAYLAWEARNLGMSKWQIARMGKNIGIDWVLGMIPIIGAIPDYFFKSNTRNLRLIKAHLDKHHPAARTLDLAPVDEGR